MRRPDALVGAVIVLGVALAACVPAGVPPRTAHVTPASTSTPAATQVPTIAPVANPTGGPVTVTYWEQDSDDADVILDQLADAFMKANPDIRIERSHFSSEELGDQFQTASTANRAPVLVRAPNELAGRLSELGIIKPIGDLYNDAFLDNFFSGSLEGVATKDGLWGVPDNYGYFLMLLYNKKLVKEPVPTDADAWIAQLKTLTDPANGKYGLVYNLNEPFWLVPWLGGFGGWPLDDLDSPALDSPAMVQALQFAHDLKYLHKVVPPVLNYSTADAMFKDGKAAYIINGDWSLNSYKDANLDLGIALLPRVGKTSRFPSPMTSGKYWMFSNKTSSQLETDAAKKFVAFMTSAPAQEKWLEMGRLPSHRDAANSDQVKKDPVLQALIAELAHGRGIPPSPQLRCAWEAMRPGLESVMADTMKPEDAARLMQVNAEKCVVEMGDKR
jgi:arabinogalactan oligomer / maltooligosaccharide transport system substrate-binding protein